MGAFLRIKPERLADRLDAVYYHPDFIKNEQRLYNSEIPISRLKSLVYDGRRAIYFSTKTLEEKDAPKSWVPFLTADDLGSEGFFIDLNARRRVSPEFAAKYSNGLIRENELLVKVKGPNQTTAYNKNKPDQDVLVSGTIWGALVKRDRVDPHYLVAILSCPYSSVARSRLRTNTNVEFLSPTDLLNLELIEPAINAQKYIGDKVRQAERLREWAKNLKSETISTFEQSISWNDSVFDVPNYGKVKVDELNNRLDLKFNSPKRLAVKRHFKNKGIKTYFLSQLFEISAMIGWKGLTTEFYQDSGPWLLRGVEFNNGVIQTEELVCIAEHKYLEQPQIHLQEGDVAFSKDGTIGKAIVIPKLPNRLAAGSTIARLRVKKFRKIDPYFLEFILNHDCIQVQIGSFATGIAQPHITQEWIAMLEIPRIDKENVIADFWKKHHNTLNLAKQLTKTAKFLVESLIEGKITEAQLISAQQALEKGDTALDQSILERLRTDGMDGEGQPLFTDSEQVYELLEQAEEDNDLK